MNTRIYYIILIYYGINRQKVNKNHRIPRSSGPVKPVMRGNV